MAPSSPSHSRAAPTASALRMCLALLCALLLSAGGTSSAAASPSGAGGAIVDTRHERHPQRRQLLQTTQHQPHLARRLEELRHADGTCHASVLSSPLPSSSDQTLTMGIVFSATNNGGNDVSLSGLGVYLDPTASPQLQFDYDVYYMDGPYATALGGDLSGDGDWQPIASAADVTKNYFSKDDTDGTSFLSFGGNVVNVPSGQTRSIYMKFSENVVTVEDRSDPGATDAQAVAETGYVGMSTQIGRKDIFSGGGDWTAVPADVLDILYPPGRFAGKLWTGQGTCSPTAAPTTAEPSLPPTPKPTTPSPTAAPSTAPTPGPTKAPTPAPIQYVFTTFRKIKFTLFGSFGPSRRGLVGKFMSRSLQGDCGLTADDLAFAEERLEDHALAVYEDLPPPASVSSVNIIITGYEDVSAAGDCSEIEFTYDQEISYQTDGSDEVTEHDLAKLPFEGDNAQVFADDLVAESPAGGKFTGATGASEATPPSGLQTRDPTSSPSVSVMPSYPPSVSPTWSPSDSPSTSSRPTMTAAPTSAPSVAPTTTAPPTLTMAPSPSPSMSPTMTAMPTGDPSAQPSMQPTVSSAPSGSPSVAPTDVPSFSPSVAPSSVPTTLINVLAQPYSFDVSYPPEEEENIKTQIVQNVTRGVENVLGGTLFLLSESYGLQLAGQTPIIVKDENATAECALDSPPENACSRFVCTMFFEHEREILPGIVTSWLLEVSDEIADEVAAVYAGQESVRTFQIMVFENVVEPPDSMDDVCPVVEEILENEPDLAEFNLLAVKCGDYTYEPPEDDDVFKRRGLRRRLAPGDLIVQFEVHAEYTPAKRDEAEGVRDEEFAALVEDSINRDQGKELRNTLQEREIIAIADDGTVQTSEKLTDRPTRAPTNAAPLESPSDESSSNSTTIAVIVVCSLVAVSVAGFFLYKGIYANKKIDDVPDWLSEDYSSVVDYHKPKPAKTELLRDSDESVEVYQEEPMEAVVYADGERNIFGDAVGASGTSSAKKGGQKEDWQDEKVDLRGSKGRHSDHSSSSQGRDQLDAFESRVRQKGDPDSATGMARSDSQAQLSAFDARLQRKLSGSRRQDSLNESMSTLDSFEERIMKKSGSGKSPIEHQSSNEFDERLQRKLERSRSGQRGRSPAQSAQEAFDERVRRKASSGTVGASASSFDDRLQKKLSRSRSRGSSVDSQGSGSSFEDRLKRKLSNSSTDRSKALASTQSSRRLDDLEARIRAKSRDGDKSRSRESSPGASFEDRLEEKLRRNNSRGALSSSTSSRDLDDFEARVAAKSKEGGSTRSSARSQGSAPSYEDRLKAKLNESAAKNKEGNRERSLANSMPGAHSSSSRNIDAFNARIAAKSKQGGESTRSLSTSSSALDSFNARIQAKSKEGGAGPESRDKQVARDRFKKAFKKAQAINTMKDLGQSEARSKERVEYNEKLSRQLQANRTESSSSLQEYEAKIRRKSAEGGSRGPSPAPSSTYEDRLKQKLAQGTSESSRSRPTRSLSATPSARSLNDFEARIAAKTKEGEGSRERARSSLTASTASSSSRVLDDLEARIAAKSTSSRASSSSGASRNRSSLSSSRSSQSKSSFEDKLAQKLASSGKSKKESTSASFEEKLARKLADKKKNQK